MGSEMCIRDSHIGIQLALYTKAARLPECFVQSCVLPRMYSNKITMSRLSGAGNTGKIYMPVVRVVGGLYHAKRHLPLE